MGMDRLETEHVMASDCRAQRIFQSFSRHGSVDMERLSGEVMQLDSELRRRSSVFTAQSTDVDWEAVMMLCMERCQDDPAAAQNMISQMQSQVNASSGPTRRPAVAAASL